MEAITEVFPFVGLDDAWSYPAWLRGLRKANGVYLFRERRTDEIVYVGESHSNRLYSTLTRHLQAWTDKYDTAGVTYTRSDVDVAVILVPAEHAVHLQNELICVLIPRDNRLQCAQIFGLDADGQPFDEDEDENHADGTEEEVDEYMKARNTPPPDYDYDIPLLLDGIVYDFAQDGVVDVPF